MKALRVIVLAAAGLTASALTHADVKVGISLSLTGPAASAGISQQKAMSTLPTKAAGENIVYTVLDDATDPTRASQNARKLVSEEHVDVLIGSTATPSTVAMTQVAAENKTPILTVAPTELNAQTLPWTFVVAQSSALMVDAVVGHMKRNKVKTVAFIGYADSFGEGWLKALAASTRRAGIEIVATERFARTDTSVLAQALRIVGANPDAVSVGASTTVAALPQRTLRDRGYKGPIYHTHGTASVDFLRAAGSDGNGALVPAGPVIVAEQLPAGHPVRAEAREFVRAYEEANGAQSRTVFASNLSDATRFLARAIPIAAAKAKPGTPEFRAALRDAMEQTKGFALANGILSNSPENHNGFDQTGVVMMRAQGGQWQLEH